MRADLEVTLAHDGCRWIAIHQLFEFSANTLDEIEKQITLFVQNTANFKDQRIVKVFIGYDFDTIPTWLRQYHTHYFNRVLKIKNN